MVWLTRLQADSSYPKLILPAMVIMAVGMASIFVPLANTALTGVPKHDAGVASAMVNASQQVGGTIGVAVLNTVFTTAVTNYIADHGGPTPQNQGLALMHGYNVAFTVSAILLAAAALIIVATIRRDRGQEAQAETRPAVHVG
jgi:MFS family permease